MKTSAINQIIPLPVPLPRGFLDMLGYETGQPLVAVYWEQKASCLIVFDGISFRPVTKDDPFIRLCMDIQVIEIERQMGRNCGTWMRRRRTGS
jgi:hypothetical protein